MSACREVAMLTINNTKQVFEFRALTMQNNGASKPQKLWKEERSKTGVASEC